MRVYNEELHEKKKIEIMQKCFDCYAEHGFGNVGIKELGKACGMSSGSLYTYFSDLDDLVVQTTEYCMSKVEDEFMAKAPVNAGDIMRFFDEVPYWTKENHGKKYRLMYQIYTNPRYVEHGKKFFEGVNKRYTEYAKLLEPIVGIPSKIIVPIIFIFVRACVHFAMFEDEYYLKSQTEVLKSSIKLLVKKDGVADLRSLLECDKRL